MGGLKLSLFMIFTFRALICISIFFVPIHLKELGFTGWQIGFIMGIDVLTWLVATLPMGISNDLVSSKKLVFLSFLLMGPAFLIISYSPTFPVFVIAFIMLGACYGLSQISLKALVYKTMDDEKRGKRLSLISFAEHFGLALGVFFGGVLLMDASFSAVFRITGILFLAVTPLALFLPKTKTHVFETAAYRREIFRKDVALFAIITFLFAFHWGAEKTVYALFLKESLGFSKLGVGIFIGLTVGALAVSALFYGKLVDMKLASMKRLILIGVLLSSVGHLLFALSQTKTQAYLFRTIHELGDSSFMIFFYVMTAILFKKSRIGGGSGFINQVTVIAAFLGSLASGAMLEHYGPRAPMIVASIFSLAALFFINRLGAESTGEEPVVPVVDDRA